MKKVIDKDGRILYKFSHSVAKGGWVYTHKAKFIENKQGLRNALNAISAKYDVIDPTVRIYDDILFFFLFVPRMLAPAEIIEAIQKNILPFAEWDKEYIFTGVYDLQEKFLRKDLEK